MEKNLDLSVSPKNRNINQFENHENKPIIDYSPIRKKGISVSLSHSKFVVERTVNRKSENTVFPQKLIPTTNQ
jgi:hypothetical protein